MIKEDELFDIQWIDSYVEDIKITKNENRCDFTIRLNYNEEIVVKICDCFYISLIEHCYFIGKDTIRDILYFKETNSAVIDKELKKWINPEIELHEIQIQLNSGSIISCLVTDKSSLECN